MLTPDKFSEASLQDLLSAASEGKVGVDHRWVRAILDRGEAAVPELVRFGLDDHRADPVDIDDALIALLRHFKSPDALPFFVEYLRRNPTDVPDELPDAMYPLRQQALEPLISLYNELEEEEAGDVAFILASFRIQDERVLRLLLDRLEYDVVEGAIALSLYGDPAAAPHLQKMASQLDDEHLKKQIQDAVQDLGRENQDDYEPPFDVFELFPEKAGPEVEALVEEDLIGFLSSSDPEYRLWGAAGFINSELTDASRAALLQSAQNDADPSVRAKAWEALSSEIADNDEIFHAMADRLQDEDAPTIERAGALVGLGQRINEEPLRKYVEQFYKNPETRAAALSAMWNSLDRTFATYFPDHLNDEDPEIRKQAIAGVGYLGIYDSAEKLKDFFAEEDYRANALFAYALAARAEISPSRVRPLLRRIDKLAGGLTEQEEELVQIALDERLLLHGHKPVFHPDRHEQ
jgi:HEAT repeat protein